MYTLFHLLTHRGAIVVANVSTGEAVNTIGIQDGWTPVVAVRVDSKPSYLLLLADLPTGISLRFGNLALDPPQILSPVLNVKNDLYTLKCVTNGKFLTAFQGDENGSSADFCATATGMLQEFRLEPVWPLSVSARLISDIELLADVLTKPSYGAAEIVSILKAHGISRSALKAVSLIGDLIDGEQEALLANDFLNESQLVEAMKMVFPNDYTAQSTLPELIEWIRAREGIISKAPATEHNIFSKLLFWKQRPATSNPVEISKVAMIDVERDHFATDYLQNGIPQRILQNLRSSVTPRRGPAVLATARNEGAYLIEWIAYYRTIGFEEIFLTTNQNEDKSDRLLSLLAEHDVIRLTRSEVGKNAHPQNKAYDYHLRAVPEILDHSWILVADIDEFLVINRESYANLNDYLGSFDEKNADSIGINWKMFGSNGNWCWSNELQMNRFPLPIGKYDHHIKSMFRPRHVMHCHPHYPVPAPGKTLKFVSADGLPFEEYPGSGGAMSNRPMDEPAVINHYFFRSAEEFLKKFANNRTDQPVSHGISAAALPENILGLFLWQFFAEPLQYSSPILISEAATRLEMARIRALPGIAEAEQVSVACFHERLPKIIEVFADSPQFKAAGELGSRLIEGLRAERSRMSKYNSGI